ncbi:hypothetical protein PTKIN_Ptkin03bG0212400 [Pterospermum kingtungense]
MHSELSITMIGDYLFQFHFDDKGEKYKIHVHRLSLAMMSERIEIVIEEWLGEVENVDIGDNISNGCGLFRLIDGSYEYNQTLKDAQNSISGMW